MALKRIIREQYVNEDLIYDAISSPLIKIKKELIEYCVPQDITRHSLEIPSIPGGKIETVETSAEGEKNYRKHTKPKLDFYYLEGSNVEDLERIREVIMKYGLERKV